MGDRKVGENFDADKASDIFDKLKKVEGKTKAKNEDSKLKNLSNLMNEAKYLENKGRFEEAIDLYNQVIFTLPDSIKAYEAIADIYRMQGDNESEKEILKKAIANCNKNDELKKRLEEIN